jgi:hypothetical protein
MRKANIKKNQEFLEILQIELYSVGAASASTSKAIHKKKN